MLDSTEDIINKTFDKITTTNESSKTILEHLKKTESSLFYPPIIDLFILLGQKQCLTINDYEVFAPLFKLNLVRGFVTTDDQQTIATYLSNFDVYFNAICMYKRVSYLPIRNKVLGFLKTKIEAPSVFTNVNVRGTISIKMVEVPATPLITNVTDMKRLGEAQRQNLIDSPEETFRYIPQTSRIEIKGPIIKSLVEGIINLNKMIIDESCNLGIKVNPFIKINNVN